MTVVYRVEHKDTGLGPYCRLGGLAVARTRHTAQDGRCFYDGRYRPVTLSELQHGCRSAGALRRWFGRRGLKELRAKGYVVVKLRVDDASFKAMGQVVFDRSTAIVLDTWGR